MLEKKEMKRRIRSIRRHLKIFQGELERIDKDLSNAPLKYAALYHIRNDLSLQKHHVEDVRCSLYALMGELFMEEYPEVKLDRGVLPFKLL